MSRRGALPRPLPSPWRILRWGALVALLLVVALCAADIGAHVVVGGHIALLPDPHFGSPIALSSSSSPAPGTLAATTLHAG